MGELEDAPSRPTDDDASPSGGSSRSVWQRLADEYEWLHTMLGIAGNALFVVGSVLFLWDGTQTAGVWLFIVGSAFMLVGSIGSALLQVED